MNEARFKTIEIDTEDLEGMLMYSLWFAIDKPYNMVAEHTTEFLLKYWDDIDELYHEQIVRSIEKMITENRYSDDSRSLKEWQKVLVKGRKYLTKPDMTEEEQEEVRKRLIDCIESGNFEVATPEQQAKTGDFIDYKLIADISNDE